MTTEPVSALVRLEQWAPIAALKSSTYAYPLLEVFHIIALAIVFGTIVIVDMRILGRLHKLDLNIIVKSILPYTVGAFLISVVTGLMMFTMRIADLIANPMFIAKICLLFCVGTNAAVLHARGAINTASLITRMQAMLSVLIWIAVIFCGRFIAYV
ncbi:MAG: hypothetical protein HC782_00230 [Gammaproteobacteria bacterium]|nr:hypothetical protein [Gammaproteobacteria bacterium]